MSDLADVKLGSIGDLKLSLVEAKLKIEVIANVDGVAASIAVAVSPRFFLDKLKAAIPGTIDDAVINALEAAFLPEAPVA